MNKASKIWMNGTIVGWDEAKIHILTHTMHYGTAVFEGLRCYKTHRGPAIFRLYDHVWRLLNSAKIYVTDLGYGPEEIAQAIKSTVEANKMDECYIRLIAYYGYGEMGVNPLPNRVNFSIAVWRWDA